jgi:WD40 repeat-containing protein SMU1
MEPALKRTKVLSEGRTVGIASSDVVRLCLQFMQENQMRESAAALQRESSVALNTVPSMERFVADVKAGRWDAVLRQVGSIELPPPKLFDLYEQVVVELLELREVDTARKLLREAPSIDAMKTAQPARYRRLIALLNQSFFDPADAYPDGLSREARREALAAALADEITVAPPSRLLSLLQQSLQWQRFQGQMPSDLGARFDLFAGRAPSSGAEAEANPTRRCGNIKFGAKSHCEAALFTRDGRMLITASVDGFIEIYDPETCKLHRELAYQAEEKFMMHRSAVLCLALSNDMEMLASGAESGQVKVWRIATGECLRRLGSAHPKGVTAVAFSEDNSHVATSSFDATARIHGLRSGNMLREFRGHRSFVNDVQCVCLSSLHLLRPRGTSSNVVSSSTLCAR